MDLTDQPDSIPQPSLIDWAAVWADLVARRTWGAWPTSGDPWTGRAAEYHTGEVRRWKHPDPIRQFIQDHIRPAGTVLDIGAGTGAWSMRLASIADHVTAVEPSPAMRAVLHTNLLAAGIDNVDVHPGHWPRADIPPHDYTLCVHAVYATPDLPAFVERMIQATRRTCFLVLRILSPGSVMTEAARHVWGHPMGGPNFIVAYNVLLQMGLTPNVLINPRLVRDIQHQAENDRNTTVDEALADVKRRFRLTSTEHDAALTALLDQHVRHRDSHYAWEPDPPSALIYWDVR